MKKVKTIFFGAVILILCTGGWMTGCAGQKLDGQEYTAEGSGGKDKYQTDPVPEGKQKPVEPEDVEIDESKAETCYFSISCETILNSMDDLKAGKEAVVPENGVIFERSEVTFYEGESVFDILQRETRENKIHMEYTFTPGFNSNYIEGIGNLYELDCGPNSGWMYCVNDWYPNYGCSRYQVQPGDEIEWNYTCDGGRDLGDEIYQ